MHSHLRSKGAYRTATLERLAKHLMDVVLSADGHGFGQASASRPRAACTPLPGHPPPPHTEAAVRILARACCASLIRPSPPSPRAKVRWSGVLSYLLVTHKKLLRLSLPWRPLLRALRDSHQRKCVSLPRALLPAGC